MTVLAVMLAVAAGPPPASEPSIQAEAFSRRVCRADCRRRARWRRVVRPHRSHLQAIARCESGNRWHISTGNGFYGGLQFTLSSWGWVGGRGYPHHATRLEQSYRAVLLSRRGGWGHWPVCG